MWEKILPDMLAIGFLGSALIMAMLNGTNEMAANIAIGLIGYIGGKGTASKKENKGD